MLLKRTKTPRRGAVVVLVCLCLVAILGIAAISLDGGMMQSNKRKIQGSADAAALDAATELFRNYPAIATDKPDPGGKALAAALASASQNGSPNDGTTSTVVVNIPPKSGPFANKLSYVE